MIAERSEKGRNLGAIRSRDNLEETEETSPPASILLDPITERLSDHGFLLVVYERVERGAPLFSAAFTCCPAAQSGFAS